jgi:hypothetical protein
MLGDEQRKVLDLCLLTSQVAKERCQRVSQAILVKGAPRAS